MKPRAAARGAFAAAVLVFPVVAEQPQTSGAEAFARRDFVAAAELWRAEAAAGSAEAKFGLGLMNDLGLGMPRDSAKALRWYLEAATDGFAAAQFNVAVMLDAGTGAPRDAVAAAVWYARAAANGHARARYNLGLLYEAGEGVPRNPDLARYWLGLAAEALPAAEQRLEALAPAKPDQRAFVAPDAVAGAIVTDDDGERVEMVWSAPPAPADTNFLVEVARLPADDETWGTMVPISTEASALAVRLPRQPGAYAWRVSRVDPERWRYAACPWQRLAEAADSGSAQPPRGEVTLRVQAGDMTAQRFARELVEIFSRAGLWVRVQPASDPAQSSSVHYAFVEDAGLAAKIADFLPVLNAGDEVWSADPGAMPGEVVVRLVGGPEDDAAR